MNVMIETQFTGGGGGGGRGRVSYDENHEKFNSS